MHSLHLYFRSHLLFLRVKDRVVNVPFPFDGSSSGLETSKDSTDTGVSVSSCESIILSVSSGGSRTAGVPVFVNKLP